MINNFITSIVRNSGIVTSVHITENSVNLLQVQRKGSKGEILKYFSSNRSEERDLQQDLDGVFRECPVKGRVVIISDEVRFLASELNITEPGQLTEEKQLAAAMWEIEPYLDFSAKEGLFACEIQPQSARGDILPSLVAAMKRTGFAFYENILKQYRLELANICAPETAIAVSLDIKPGNGNKFVIGCYGNRIIGVSLTDQGPAVFQEKMLIAGDEVRQGLAEIIDELTAISGEADEIVLAGGRISEEVADLYSLDHERVRMWQYDDLKSLFSENGINIQSEYAAAAGAALNELDIRPFSIPVLTSRVPVKKLLIKKVNENPKIVPLITVILLIFLLAFHYVYTMTSISINEKRLDSLEIEESSLTGPIEEAKRLRNQLEQIRNKVTYIEETLPQCNAQILNMLDSVSGLIPRDVVLDSIRQEQGGEFTLEGNSYSGQSITDFNDSLSSLEYCETTVLENVSRPKKSIGAREKILPYSFSIKMRFSPWHSDH
ncbi:MAG: PilN domain-containing protein [Desulfobacteraceae bacterium]|jgi:Tfp pilus assembly protein PilN